jgi:subtilase family serine protease
VASEPLVLSAGGTTLNARRPAGTWTGETTWGLPDGSPGTSASAPLWAGIIALADQFAKRHLGFVNPAVYRIARGSRYHQAFHDITAGPANTAKFRSATITGYRAGPGWDPVTGWGSPNAQVLVPLLDRYATR